MQESLTAPERKFVVVAYLLLAAVYIAGLFVRLMNNDAGEYALIALNMSQKNDFINIVRKGEDYLDKPHLLFWLSAISFKIFGVNGVAYKLPSLLFSVIAIYSTTNLATILFNRKTGIIAGLVLAYSQAFIIANYDVRTDAILTGATAFAIYQFLKFASHKRYVHIILGSLGLALAVGTKGMIAVIVTGLIVLIHLLYHRRFTEIFTWHWLSSIVWFFIFLSPFLYCYYLQFDAHPEKTTNGVKGMSGIKFLLWTQSFERLAGQRNLANNNDFLFFFHTFLWAFLPWSIIAYYETFKDWITLARRRFKVTSNIEFALSGSVLVIILLMSTSQFKLPHYLNILFPLFAIITAKCLVQLTEKRTELPKSVAIYFYLISSLYILLGLVLNAWAFPIREVLMSAFIITMTFILAIVVFKENKFSLKPFFVTLFAAGIVNFILNINFFPKVLTYQGSSALADFLNVNDIPAREISSFTSRRYFSFDFYIQKDIPEPSLQQLQQRATGHEALYVITDRSKYEELKNGNLPLHTVKAVPHFHISRLNWKFINPATRPATLDSLMLVRIN